MWLDNLRKKKSKSPQEPLTSTLATQLDDKSVPTFLFGCTPPREGTDTEKALQSCQKFTNRSAAIANDGFIVYDIQDEAGRTEIPRPFPFRKTLDPSTYAAMFAPQSGKSCVVYHCAVQESEDDYRKWLHRAVTVDGHDSFVLVGAATSKPGTPYKGMTLKDSAKILTDYSANIKFGCVAIAERHSEAKGFKEHLNMMRKQTYGAEFFITQGIYDSSAVIKLINDYGNLCQSLDVKPKKVILTFAPCGREKTMTFIKWLGMKVPVEVEAQIFSKKHVGEKLPEGERDLGPVNESCAILANVFQAVLEGTHQSGVPLGVNVESLSIFREEIDAAHTLFQTLQTMALNFRAKPWSVKWYDVGRGGTCYDDIMVVEKEKDLRRRQVIITAVVGVLIGAFIGRRSGMEAASRRAA
jgi:5,10-methylenetetrahydrofolate reductase